MKIGILTYHRSHNYGALLQAVALRHTLTKFGHDAYFVDYWPEYHKDMYRVFSPADFRSYSLFSKIKYIVKTTLLARNKIKRINSFNKFIDEFITPYSLPTTEDFDIIIYGSDQIWRRQPRLDNRFNPVYFGCNEFIATKHISYAASMGNISDITPDDEDTLKKWFQKFAFISVREKNLQQKLSDIGIANVSTVLDPTLLLKASEWIKLLKISPKTQKPYVLFYDLMPDSFDISRIRDFAKSKNLDLIVLKARVDKFMPQKNEYVTENPRDMVSLIAHAEYVFTSSYHGLIFSIIFEKEFIASFKTNQERANSLLTVLKIPQRLMMGTQFPFPNNLIDYKSVSSILESQRNISNEILNRELIVE